MVETPHPHGEHGDGSTVDGAAIVGRYWPYDGPHSPDTVLAAAEALAELVRYANNATGPGTGTHTLPHASHVYRVLGGLDAALGGLVQLVGNLLWASVNHAADPTLYDDRRDRPALDTCGKLDTALDWLREQVGAVADTVAAARSHSAHLGHEEHVAVCAAYVSEHTPCGEEPEPGSRHCTQHQPVCPGDRVRIGRGYQEWTVRTVDGAELVIEADPGRQTVASSPFQRPQTRRVSAASVTRLAGGER